MSNASVLDESDGNTTAVFICHEQRFIDDVWFRVVVSILYFIIFSIGVFGNLIVILAVAKNKAMQNPTNVFIVNMAMSDIFMCLFAVPFTPIHSFMNNWVFGEVLCKLFPSSQGISVYMSTLTLTCIAVDRYFAIVHPHRPRMETRTAAYLAAAVNLTALLFTAPYAWNMTVRSLNNKTSEVCTESWSGMPRTIYGAFTNITQFVLPFTTIFVCYSFIMYRLAKRHHSRPGGSRQSAAKEEAEKERRRKNNRLCVSMVVIFGTCWLPLNMVNFLADTHLVNIVCWRYYHFTFFLCHILAMSSNCYNPFLYGWFNEAFRTEFFRMLPCLATLCGRGGTNSTNEGVANRGNGTNATGTKKEEQIQMSPLPKQHLTGKNGGLNQAEAV